MTSLTQFFLVLLTSLSAIALSAQPGNDDCSAAFSLTMGSICTSVSYTSVASTGEDLTIAANPSCNIYQGGDVWFSFTVPASGDFRVTMSGNSWSLYSGTCGDFTELFCDGDNHNFSDPSLAGETLYLRAFRFNNANGSAFDLCIWEPDVPVNDLCADAISLSVGTEYDPQVYSSLYSTAENPEPAANPSCNFYQGGDVWFSFTVPSSGDFRVAMSGNSWSLYSGTCGDFTELFCDGNNNNFSDPSLAGETLYLRAFQFNSDQGGDFELSVWEPEVPANDLCSNAIVLSVPTSYAPQSYSSRFTTAENPEPAANPSCNFYQGGDVWFSFTVPVSGDFRVAMSGNSWSLYSGTCGDFTELSCDGNNNNFSDPSLAGETLYLRAFQFNSDQGGDFELSVWEPIIPANDDCADAIEITVGQTCSTADFSTLFTTSESTGIAPDPSCDFYNGGDVWFTFTAPLSGNFRIELTGNSWSLYTGSCSNFTEVRCDAGGVNFSDPDLGGENLYLRAFRFNSDQGADFSLCIWEIDVPENNLCANATNIALSDSCAYTSFTSRYSTAEGQGIASNPSCAFYKGGDVWFTFSAPLSGQFSLNKANNTNGGNTFFSFYNGTCGDFEEVLCSGDSEISFNDPTLGGEVIYVRAFSFNNRSGADFDLCIINTTVAENDNCVDAISLEVGSSCTFETFNNFNTTEEAGIAPDPTCGIFQGSDVWFSFEVPATGQFQINRNSISGNSFTYALYTGSCGSFVEYDCSADGVQGLFDATELSGQTVYLRVFRFNSSFGGEFELCVVAGDCNGAVGGNATLDECGTCVGGNTGLEACIEDCNGVFGGTASLDNCGTCVNGNTGLEACVEDCNGDFGGAAFLDNCGTCVNGNTGLEACVEDCNGDFGGAASLDNCGTCVNGNTGLEACVEDCNGDFGGIAFLDNCEVCVGGETGESPCSADCNGDFGGTAFIDNCETCVNGNTGLEACIEDCNGDFGGTAFLDNCETCVNGNTGIEACVEDCNGDFGGTAVLDNCEICVGGETGETACTADCNGDFGGTAVLDNCEICVGGETGETACTADCNGDFGGSAVLDNCGTCVGGETELEACAADCNGDFGGDAVLDNCGICVGGETGETACTADCNGDFGGTAVLDNCEICVGGETGETACTADCNGDFGGTAVLDNCGTCVGGETGETACTADCNGDFGGTAVLDNCEICVGGETGETACTADCNGDFGGTAVLDNCGTCVGGDTELEACTTDCNGDFGGDATLDDCGVCDADPANDNETCEDCAGVPNGGSTVDACGVCDSDPSNDNETCADCNGDPNGSAFLDNCGTCVGGETELEACTADCNGDFGGDATLDDCGVCDTDPANDNETCEDCAGVPNGGSTVDACGVCDSNPTNDNETCADCNGDPNGTAFLDNCGTCVGGETELEACTADCNGDFGGDATLDDCGVCDSIPVNDNETCEDCAGVPNGGSTVDACGVCDSDPSNDNETCADCNGDPNGSAFLDNCGTCVGGDTELEACTADCNGDFGGDATLDDCGVCDADPANDNETCEDCAGVPNGGSTVDACGVCDSDPSNDNETCADCNGDANGTAFLDNCGTCVGGETGEIACDFDCPSLEADIGDACDDTDPNTENDQITNSCGCEGIPIATGTCEEFVYYLADYSGGAFTDIYEVSLVGEIAMMTYVASASGEVHIAYDTASNLLYAVGKLTNSYQTLNPHLDNPTLSAPVNLGTNLGQLTGATFAADGNLLLSSQSTKIVYSVDIQTNAVTVFDSYSPILGGDIATDLSGTIFLATNLGNSLYKLNQQNLMADLFLGSLGNMSTGLAATDTDQLLVSRRNNSSLELLNPDGSPAGFDYDLMVNGEPFTLAFGDMASGCNTFEEVEPETCENFRSFYAQLSID